MMEVEGGTPEWCDQLLRHECGHAVDHAYRFSSRRRWREVFGSPNVDYEPETYRPRPYSRSFVRHLPNWYAQAHPDEDFAETFAVWLAMPPEDWRARYFGWKAIEKLEYVDGLMGEVRRKAPAVRTIRRHWRASTLRSTLGRYYTARRKLWAEDQPDFYDGDLRRIFDTRHAGRPRDGGGVHAKEAAGDRRRACRAGPGSASTWSTPCRESSPIAARTSTSTRRSTRPPSRWRWARTWRRSSPTTCTRVASRGRSR